MRAPRLSHALAGARAASDAGAGRAPIALGRGVVLERAEFARRVLDLAAAIEGMGRGRWLLHCESSYAAAVGLLALLQAGCTAVLAPNRQAETLRQLAGYTRGALLDGGVELEALPRLDPLAAPAAAREPVAVDPEAPFVEFHSSGTTGDRKGTQKSLRHLEDEIATLEALFGPGLPEDAQIFSSVSHQHVYGLLFGVLWPLATGRPFRTESGTLPQELLPRMQESPACALVSTPAHLRRAAAGEGLAPLRGVCRSVFSSGAPLDAETAGALAAQLGAAPIEVLGSTETGGVALRRRDADGEAWTALPGVLVQQAAGDGRLVVTSRFASEGADAGGGRRRFATGDRIALRPDGRFLLLGRADRVVKIGGKRLSLPDMERELEAHACVEQAALAVFEHASEPRVHGVIVPSRTGREALALYGRSKLGAALAEHLARHFDRVLLPRRWRVVDALPRDAQGKLPLSALRALFEEREPALLDETRTQLRLERRLEVPVGLAHLEGHFEGAPVVAGVVLLHWVLAAAGELLGAEPRLRALEALKFPSLLRPGQRFSLRVELDADRQRLRFLAFDADRVYASGRGVLAPPE